MSSEGEYQHGKPAEGMCCMCTYEDITEEAQNYGKIGMLIPVFCFCFCHLTQHRSPLSRISELPLREMETLSL